MKKTLSIILAVTMALCLCVPAMAAGSHTVTIINGMDGSVAETFTVADGEDLVFSISCAAPADMGPVADGELGSGVTTTVGTITYSNVTTGGPNAYPTAETVTVSGITKDATVTVTPNPDEVDSVFPTITEGELAGGASGEASGEASSDEPYPMFEEYKEYLYETLMQDAFWQGNEENLRAGLDAAETPDDESIQNFTGSGDVDQAPAGVVFPMTYDAWYAENGGASEEPYPMFEEYKEYLYETMMQDAFWQGNEESLVAALEAAQSPDDESIQNFTGSGDVDQAPAGVVFPMTYDAWYAENGGASGEAAGGQSVEDAYVEYIHEFLLAELEINSSMTIEQIEDEFMPLVEAGDYVSFPADMLYNGMLNSGAAMTFEEFAAQ